MVQFRAELLAGGFFLLAALFYFLRESKQKTLFHPLSIFLASIGVLWSALAGDPFRVLVTTFSLAIVLSKKEDFGFHSLALAGSLFLFFSPHPINFLSAWLLVDLLLLSGWGVPEGLPGHLFSQGAGILAFMGWKQTGFPPLLFLSAFARAGFFPWPRSSFKSPRLAFLPVVMAFYILKDAVPPGWPWLGILGLWLAFGTGFELPSERGFPQALWGCTVPLVLFGGWGFLILFLAFAVAALREEIAKAWPIGSVLFQWLGKGLRGVSEFIEGEGGWLWVGLLAVILLRGLGLDLREASQGILWRELFPEGVGLMSTSFYILVTESEFSLLFSLLAQYIIRAFHGTPPSPGNWLIAARLSLGAMVCLILYLSRWGARWIRPSAGAVLSRKERDWWLLRVMLGIGGGLLAFLAFNRYPLFSSAPEERLVVFWVLIMGLLATLAPGSVLQRAAGVLTFIAGLELAGLVPEPAVWFVHLAVATAASFLAAYDKARGK